MTVTNERRRVVRIHQIHVGSSAFVVPPGGRVVNIWESTAAGGGRCLAVAVESEDPVVADGDAEPSKPPRKRASRKPGSTQKG